MKFLIQTLFINREFGRDLGVIRNNLLLNIGINT